MENVRYILFLQSSPVKLNGHWQKNFPIRSMHVAEGGHEFSLQSIMSSSQVLPVSTYEKKSFVTFNSIYKLLKKKKKFFVEGILMRKTYSYVYTEASINHLCILAGKCKRNRNHCPSRLLRFYKLQLGKRHTRIDIRFPCNRRDKCSSGPSQSPDNVRCACTDCQCTSLARFRIVFHQYQKDICKIIIKKIIMA